ncbi:MAG: hypothetical protein ABI175_17965, partial [Polyangiales bacterium]
PMLDADANEAISQAWAIGWDAIHGDSSGDAVADVLEGEIGDAGSEWVRMAIVPSVSQLQTLDAQQRERTAIISVQIFTLPVSNTRRVSELVDDVRSVLEAKVFASSSERIWTMAATATPGVNDGAWVMRLVTVPCRWYG